MSHFQYYQQQPQWGTSGYQVVAPPPAPVFQPQAGWSGRNFFQAQAGLGYGGYGDGWDDVRDEGFFDGIFRGIKDIFSRGMARSEARHWHQQVYSGMAPIDQLDAAHIGGAAGYEAIRHWRTYAATYSAQFRGDRELEREALAGLAAGEAVKLLNYSQFRQRSRRSRREVAEIAAATAERIFTEDFDDPYDDYESGGGRRLRRRRSSLGSDYARTPYRRRSSSFSMPGQPIMAATTGGTYMTAQPTGASYVTASPTGYAAAQYMQPGYTGGVQYAQPGVQYVQQQPGVQYVQGGQAYGSPYGQQVAYGQPQVYGQQMYGQPQVMYGGQQQYATVGQPYGRQRALSVGYTGAPNVTYI